MKKEKSKCEKCNKDAVIIENEKYYCADCYIIIKNIPTPKEQL